jgi:hypothetical protein
VIAEENDAHIEDKEKCWKCDAVATADTRTDKAKFLDALIDNIVQK